MSKPMVRIQNAETGKVIDREMTDAELQNHLAELNANELRQAEAEAKAQAKAELLERLGITADEAKLLLA
jgi:hypothetical protein